jgi:transcriptional regulator with XRE-family HTH domain
MGNFPLGKNNRKWDNSHMEWRENIRFLIKLNRFDRKNLSKALGGNDTYVRDILSTTKDPGVFKLISLAKQLGVSLSDIVSTSTDDLKARAVALSKQSPSDATKDITEAALLVSWRFLDDDSQRVVLDDIDAGVKAGRLKFRAPVDRTHDISPVIREHKENKPPNQTGVES